MIVQVENLIRDVAQSVILPRYRRLRADEIEEKSPGELVTIVDREAEAILIKGLGDCLAGCPFVGEEAVAANPEILVQYYRGGGLDFWLIDPLDGTANFAAGEEAFAVMVALIRGGETVMSFVYEPAHDRMCVAERGGGTFVNGIRVHTLTGTSPQRLTGSILGRFLPAGIKAVVERNTPKVDAIPGSKCAGRDYVLLARGEADFNLYWRLLPWDHGPGVLILTEAGGFAGYLNGQPYDPMIPRDGLIAAVSETRWHMARDCLLAGI